MLFILGHVVHLRGTANQAGFACSKVVRSTAATSAACACLQRCDCRGVKAATTTTLTGNISEKKVKETPNEFLVRFVIQLRIESQQIDPRY